VYRLVIGAAHCRYGACLPYTGVPDVHWYNGLNREVTAGLAATTSIRSPLDWYTARALVKRAKGGQLRVRLVGRVRALWRSDVPAERALETDTWPPVPVQYVSQL
jgi:hypothetical protein